MGACESTPPPHTRQRASQDGPGGHRHPSGKSSRVGPGVLLEVEDQPGFHLPGFHFVDCPVNVAELAALVDHVGLARGVQLEDFLHVDPGADDRPEQLGAVEHGLEDGELNVVVGRQPNEDQGASAPQRPVGLLECFRRDGGASCTPAAVSSPGTGRPPGCGAGRDGVGRPQVLRGSARPFISGVISSKTAPGERWPASPTE